jgi:hypothetical protein
MDLNAICEHLLLCLSCESDFLASPLFNSLLQIVERMMSVEVIAMEQTPLYDRRWISW